MKNIKGHIYRIWKVLSERKRRKLLLEHYEIDFIKYKNDTNKKPSKQIKKELKALQSYWNCYPFQYYRFDMYSRDCHLTMQEMLDYVPRFFIEDLVLPKDNKDYFKLLQNKYLSYILFEGCKTPQPKILFRYELGQFYDLFNQNLNDEKTDDLIENTSARKIFIKPNFGLGGKGIIVYNRNHDRKFENEGNLLNADQLKKDLGNTDYIIQEGIEQSEELSGIYPHSINTFRIITICNNKIPSVRYTFLRMGRGGNQIDNASSGGIFIKVDKETGKLGNHAFEHSEKRIFFEKHPDTGFIFKDYQLQCWDSIKEFVIRNAIMVRDIRYIGWDVCMTESGPVLIELNGNPGIDTIQDIYGGIREDLEIKKPKEWWYTKDISIVEKN